MSLIYDNGNYIEIEDSDTNLSQDLESLRVLKKQELSEKCQEVIFNGFYSSVGSDTPILYGYDLIDQANWDKLYNVVLGCKNGIQTILNLAESQGFPTGMVAIKSKFDYNWKLLTYDQFLELYADSLKHLNYNRTIKYYHYIDLIDSATTIAEVQSITWE